MDTPRWPPEAPTVPRRPASPARLLQGLRARAAAGRARPVAARALRDAAGVDVGQLLERAAAPHDADVIEVGAEVVRRAAQPVDVVAAARGLDAPADLA